MTRVALTYEIPSGFGGLTQAMLTRTVQMTHHGQQPCLVLTVGPQPELPEVRDDLVHRGLLVDPAHLRNLWEDLAQDHWLDGLPFDDQVREPDAIGVADVVIQRPDGSRLAVQRWTRLGIRTPVAPAGDAVTDTWLWRSDGTYAGHLSGTWALWRHWLAGVVADLPGERVDVIVDSATVADAVAGLESSRARLAVVIHNNHLRLGATPPVAPLNRWRSHLLRRAEQFDLVVFLTEQQRRDAEVLLGTIPNSVAIANIGPEPDRTPRRRTVRHGLMLAALTPRKRVDHAIRALANLPDVTLTVHGRGERQDALQREIDRTGAAVDLAGYTTDAREALRAASFLLLTSSGEGLPMVLLEAMSTGCIPVAYDIAYGPRDVITDGVDGILVSPPDETALAAAVARLTSLSRWRIATMRRAAVKRARAYAASAVIARWDAALSAPARRVVHRPDDGEERRAAVTRFLSPDLMGRLHRVVHRPDGVVDLYIELDVLANGLPEAQTEPVEGIRFDLVDRTTGTRTPLEASVEDRRHVVTCRVADLRDRSLLVTGTVWGVPASGLITGTTGQAPLQVFAPDRRSGEVLVVDGAVGLTVATARPRSTATIEAAPDGLRIQVVDGEGDVDQLELTAGGQTRMIEPEQPAAFLAPADLPPGRWRVRARHEGRWHEVALTGPVGGPATDPIRPLHVDLTPKGYLRLVSRHGTVVVDDLTSTGGRWILSGTATCQAELLIGRQTLPVGPGAWSAALDPDDAGGAIRSRDVEVVTSPELQGRWPVSVPGAVLHRRGTKAEPAVTRRTEDHYTAQSH